MECNCNLQFSFISSCGYAKISWVNLEVICFFFKPKKYTSFMSFIFLQIVIFQLLLMTYNLWYSDFQSQPHYVFYKKKITSFMSFILIPFFFLEHFLDDKNVFSKRNTNFIHSICTEFARIWNCLSSNQCASQRKKQKYEKEKEDI